MPRQFVTTTRIQFRPNYRAPRRHGRAASLTGTAIAALLAWSMAVAAPPVSVSDARIRLLPGDLPLAGYFVITNQSKQSVKLTGASSPDFKMVHLHRSMEQGGMSMMAPVEGIDVKPGETLRFAPGGYHLMLMQRVKPLKVGDKVPVTLRFAGNQSLQVMFVVEGAGAQ